MPPPTSWRTIASSIAAFILLAGLTIAFVDNGPDHGPDKPRGSVTITLGGPGAKKVTLPPAAQATAKAQAHDDATGNEDAAHSDLRTEKALSDADRAANDAKRIAGAPVLPAHAPLAAQSIPGCRTLPVRNYSSRNGAPILLFVFHYTVSVDNGWAGVLGNVKWFDSAAASASSTYIADRRTGACALAVPEYLKAWAQAAYNPWALSLEVTATGREGSYLPPGAGRDRVLYLMHRAHRVYKLPYRRGAVSGGRVVRSGFVMHADLGAAGGGHFDVRPYGIDDLIAEAARTDGASAVPATPSLSVLTKGERRAVDCVQFERKVAARHGGWSKIAPSHLRRASACKGTLRARNRELHRLGLASKADRSARHRVIHAIL
jgi:hypothetical protein